MSSDILACFMLLFRTKKRGRYGHTKNIALWIMHRQSVSQDFLLKACAQTIGCSLSLAINK